MEMNTFIRGFAEDVPRLCRDSYGGGVIEEAVIGVAVDE
jgi:hypothetical protein